MTALTENLSLTGEIVSVDDPLLVGEAYHLEDEIVVASGSVTLNYADAVQHNRWRIRRGQDHTTPATHSSGAALTLAREFETGGAGGGGVTVDNTVDAPAEVTTLIAPGADLSTPGEATLVTEQAVLSRSTLLTDAQIKALPATAIDLVPAPGAGKVLIYLGGFILCDSSGGYYDYDLGTAPHAIMRIGLGNIRVSAIVDDAYNRLSSLIQAEDVYVAFLPPLVDYSGSITGSTNVHIAGPEAVTSVVNLPLRLRANNGSGVASTAPFTGGDPANYMTVTVLYTIVDLP